MLVGGTLAPGDLVVQFLEVSAQPPKDALSLTGQDVIPAGLGT
jgi:hypothetical protein